MPGTLTIGGGDVGTAGGSVQCRRLGELLVVFLSDGLLDGFLAMAHAGVELAAPAPRAEAVLQPTLSHPPQHEPGRRALERRVDDLLCG